jgi:SSS family transporter
MNNEFNIINFVFVAVYLAAMMLSGVLFSKNEKTTEQYFLGGRKMPTYVVAISMFLTLFSSITFVAVPGEAFGHGLSMSLPLFLTPLGTLIGFSIFMKFYFVKGTVTPYSYLERRFDGGVRLFVSVIFIVMRLFYLGVVMYATAKYFKYITGWPIWMTVFVLGLVGIFYTTLGGVKAVIWMDFFQFFILVLGIGLILWKIFSKVEGGLCGTLSYAFENGRGFEALKNMKQFMSLSIYERFTLWTLLGGMVCTYTFIYGCDQMTIQRLLCTSSYEESRKATIINVLISIPVSLVFWLIGLGLFYFYNTKGISLPQNLSADEVLSYFVVHELPTPIPGLMMVAILTAAMSTINAGMNSLSAVFVKDIYLRHINSKASAEQEMKVSKLGTAIWGIIFILLGIGIGSFSESVVSSILEVAGIWGALLGVAAGTFFLGVTTKKAHKGIIYLSALTAIIVLCILVFNYYTVEDMSRRVSFNIIGMSPFVVMLVVGYALCLIWPDKKNNLEEGLTLWTYRKVVKEKYNLEKIEKNEIII